MATNDEIRLAYQRHWDAAYAEEYAIEGDGMNGAPVTDMAYQRTMAELGCTWHQVDEAVSEKE